MLRGLSLTWRLTLFFTGAAAVVVLGLGWLFMAATERHFVELDRTALEDKKHLIESILSNANSADDTVWRLGEALSHHHGLFVQVKGAHAETIFQSDGFMLPESHSKSEPNEGAHALHAWKSGGNEFHALHFQAHPKFNQEARFDITVAMDTSHHRQFLSELQRTLVMHAVMATLVSGLLGWLGAHQGMAPLRAMRARAASVTAQQLEERMQVDAVPIEMADLAHALNQMLDRLQQDFRRLSEFSSDLAHEFRTPISNLLTQTQVTLSATRDVGTYRDILASNAEELQRMARMVSDMLFLAKTEGGVALPNLERFPAILEVQALLDFYDALADEKTIHLSALGDGDIRGDRLMFRRAVSNLLSNALRHTPQGGEVRVVIEKDEKMTRVTVENTGKAIEPQVLPRLFDRFYRADPARSHPDSGGAGLGLSITKAIVEAHGGSAGASSDSGKTRFFLEFPSSR